MERLERAYDLIKVGEKRAARALVDEYLAERPRDGDAWRLRYFCAETTAEKREALEMMISIDPDNQEALQALNKLNATGKQRGWVKWALLFGGFGLFVIIMVFVFFALQNTLAAQFPPTNSPAAFVTEIQFPTDPLPPPPTFTMPPTYSPVPTLTPLFVPTLVIVTFTPAPTTSPTLTLAPSETLPPNARGNVQILDIRFVGSGLGPEPDEYVEFANLGNAPEDMTGWILDNGSPVKKNFTFPKFTIQPNQLCRVYTNEVHSEFCGFSFQSESSIWNNRSGCARLYNARGLIIDEYCYNTNR